MSRNLSRNIRVYWVISGIFLIFPQWKLCAGVVSLRAEEVPRLRALIRTNSAAAAQFLDIHKAADFALKDQPAPIEKIISQGRLESDPEKKLTQTSLADMAKTESLAWTWAVTGDERYAAQARKYLSAWAGTNKPDGDPINETKFEPMIVAYDLLRPGFPDADRRAIDNWLRTKAVTLLEKAKSEKNNWANHRLKIVGLIGLTLNDEVLIQQALQGFREQVGAGLEPDGSSLDFKTRDALHYHLYTIEPLLALARAASRHGVDLFDYRAPNGASLHHSVDFVVPFAQGEKKHLEFANSKVAFDRKRAENGEKEYQIHLWNPKSSSEMFSQAAWFVPSYGVMAAKLSGRPELELFNWQMVINAASYKKP